MTLMLRKPRFLPGLLALFASAALILVLAGGVFALPPSPVTCNAVVTVAIVCTQWSCSYTAYVDDYWCSRTPLGDISPIAHNPADVDHDLLIDDFKDVLATNDPCAWEFDLNDRLGSNHGGPNNTLGRKGHLGVDIQANEGDDVGAMAHGQITFAGWHRADHSKGCGYMVTVRHINGDTSSYCHLVADSNTFEVGDYVRAGTVIGKADSTGSSTGHHLHLVYKEGGTTPKEYWDALSSKPSPGQLLGSC